MRTLTYKAHYPHDAIPDTGQDLNEVFKGQPVMAGTKPDAPRIGEVVEAERTEEDVVLTMELEDSDLARAMTEAVGWVRYIAAEVHPEQIEIEVTKV